MFDERFKGMIEVVIVVKDDDDDDGMKNTCVVVVVVGKPHSSHHVLSVCDEGDGIVWMKDGCVVVVMNENTFIQTKTKSRIKHTLADLIK